MNKNSNNAAQNSSVPRTGSLKTSELKAAQSKKWHVGTMNDGYFVIDQKPQPAPVDYVCEMDHDVNVIAACGAKEDIANLLVAEHNARLEAEYFAPLDCAMCDAPKSFLISPLDPAVGYCFKEQKAGRIKSLTCATAGCLRPKAVFGDHCMPCLENRVNSETSHESVLVNYADCNSFE